MMRIIAIFVKNIERSTLIFFSTVHYDLYILYISYRSTSMYLYVTMRIVANIVALPYLCDYMCLLYAVLFLSCC